MYRWKLAWGEQFISTDQIEDILIDSGADISFASVHKIAEARYGTGVEVVEIDPEQQHYGVDKKALSIFGTLLIFREGQFAGSRANLPNWPHCRSISFGVFCLLSVYI